MADPTPFAEREPHSLDWASIIGGAFAAAALAFVLHSFAAAIGFSLGSTAPTWRDASIALVLASGLYLVLVALAAYAFGAYLTGRLRARAVVIGTAEEREFRDGVHGLMVWALATLLTGLLAFGSAQVIARLAAPSGGTAGTTTSVAGENIIAYDLDRLFRTERRTEGDLTYARSEAARILLQASSHRGILPEDRVYLVRLVANRTGLAAADAEKRVDDVIARAKENINRARSSAVVLAFCVGAAALLGAAIAFFAAWAGGRHRDGLEATTVRWHLWGPVSAARP